MTGVIVKICGVTDPDGAAACARAGADWIGLNFWPGSKRAVERDKARAIAAAIRAAPRPTEWGGGRAEVVGVFVNEDPEVVAAIDEEVGLDRIQLSGDEPAPEAKALGRRAIAALRPTCAGDLEPAWALPAEVTVLVDAPAPGYGGSGQLADWRLAEALAASGRRVMLAGGLRPDNVADAVGAVCPFGVDVASGVESAPGEKDPALVRAFVRAAKAAGPKR